MKAVKWINVVRDICIVWAISIAGIVLFQMSLRKTPGDNGMTFWGTVGFFVIGCLTKENRFKHIVTVGVLFWISNSVNIIFGMPVSQWIGSLFQNFLMVALGGGVSNFFVKKKPSL